MSMIKSYVKQVLANITGDKDAVIAEQNYRLATSAVKGQLAALRGAEVKVEVNVERAKKALDLAKYPARVIEDTEDYLANVYAKQQEFEEAESDLEDVREAIANNEALLKEFESEEEAE